MPWMGAGCCQHAGCTICSDTFTRAAGTNILPFIEEVGDWSIDNGQLKEAGTNGARAYCPNRHRHLTDTGVVWATVKNVQEGDRPMLFLNHTPGSAPTEWLKLFFNASNKVAMQVGAKGSVASWSPGGTYSAGTDYVMKICRTGQGIYGGVTSLSHLLYTCVEETASPTRRYAGVGNHGTQPVWFDDFVFQEHYTTDQNCEKCGCECDGTCLPQYLLVTLQSDNPARDGAEVQLKLDEAVDPAWEWYGEAEWHECQYGSSSGAGTGHVVGFRFYCNRPDLCSSGWYMSSVDFQDACTTSDWGGGGCGVEWDCDPFEIRFGPYTCSFSGGDPPSCTETLIVTIP